MYSVEMIGRLKMNSLWKYSALSTLVVTELKKVSAHSGCL